MAWPGRVQALSGLVVKGQDFRLEAYTGEVDDSIVDTYLQHGLKRHPST